MNCFQLIHRDETARDSRLIRDEHHPGPRPIQTRHRLHYSREKIQLLRRCDVPRVTIHRPIPIENDGHAGQI